MQKQTEESLQRAVVTFLAAARPNCLWFSIPNEHGSRSERIRLSVMGLLPGIADLAFIHPGLAPPVLFIELKTARGRQSQAQKAFERACRGRYGLGYMICRSVQEVADALLAWGVQFKNRVEWQRSRTCPSFYPSWPGPVAQSAWP